MSEGKRDEDRDRGRDRKEGSGEIGPKADRTDRQTGADRTGAGAPKAGARDGAGLTERQRREARELRRRRRRSGSGGRGDARTPDRDPISRGLKATATATATEIGRAATFIGRGFRAVVGRIASVLLVLLEAVLAVGSAISSRAGRLVAATAGLASGAALILDRILTPARAVISVTVLAAVMLAVSQFLDYRAVEIGGSGYDQIRDLTQAPRTDVESPIATHSVVLLVAVIAALVCCLGLIVTGKRFLALPILAAGVITLAVGLAIDLPRGLDAAAASAAYADARPVLLAGFWLEIASGAVLAVAGLIMTLGPAGALAAERTAATDRSRATRRDRRSRAAAGGAA